jgi:E3 ubiquitin-protein ligase HUWE1
MVWENILLRESVPKSWYNFKQAKKSGSSRSDNPLGISVIDTTRPTDTVSGSTPSNDTSNPAASAPTDTNANEDKEPDANDSRALNTKHFKMFLGDIPQALTPIFQGKEKKEQLDLSCVSESNQLSHSCMTI